LTKASEVLEEFLKFMNERARENHKFLQEKIRDLPIEVVELINDIEDVREKLAELYRRDERVAGYYLMYPALVTVCMSQSYMVFVSLLLGNIPVACYCLRVMIEALECAVYLDLKYRDRKNVFEKARSRDYTSFSPCKLKRNIAKVLGNERLAEALCIYYKHISSFWTHPATRLPLTSKEGTFPSGLLIKIIKALVERGIPPSYAFVIPISYDENDLEDLRELLDLVQAFRESLKQLVDLWFRSVAQAINVSQ